MELQHPSHCLLYHGRTPQTAEWSILWSRYFQSPAQAPTALPMALEAILNLLFPFTLKASIL